MLPRTGTISMPLASGPGWARFCWARETPTARQATAANIRRWLIFFKTYSCLLLSRGAGRAVLGRCAVSLRDNFPGQFGIHRRRAALVGFHGYVVFLPKVGDERIGSGQVVGDNACGPVHFLD